MFKRLAPPTRTNAVEWQYLSEANEVHKENFRRFDTTIEYQVGQICLYETGIGLGVFQLISTANVNHPQHYTDGPPCPACGEPVECITVTERMNFNVGNAVKYLWRAGKKDEAKHLEDLKKAQWYVAREIERLSK